MSITQDIFNYTRCYCKYNQLSTSENTFIKLHLDFRKDRREQGLSVVIDGRRQPPVPALLSSLSELQVSPQWTICNYPPTHTQRVFRPCLHLCCPLSLNVMSLKRIITRQHSLHFSYCSASWSLTPFGFLKRHTFQYVVTAVLRHFCEKGLPQGSCGEACAYLSVFNHTLGAGGLQLTYKRHIIML